MFKKTIAFSLFFLIIQPVTLRAALPLDIGLFIISEIVSIYRSVSGERVNQERYDDICRRLNRIENSLRNNTVTDSNVKTISEEDYRTLVNSFEYLKRLTSSIDSINERIESLEDKTNSLSHNLSGKIVRMENNISGKLERIDNSIKKLSLLLLALNEPWEVPLKKGISSIECEEAMPYLLCSGFKRNNRSENLFYSEASPYYLSIDIENINVDLESSHNCIAQEAGNSVFYRKSRGCSGGRCCSAHINSDIIVSLKKNGEVMNREQTSVTCLNTGKKFQITYGIPFIMDKYDAEECRKNIITKAWYGINSIENYLVSRNRKAMQALKELSYIEKEEFTYDF